MATDKEKNETITSQIKDEVIIIDPSAVPIIFHQQKGDILKLLIEKDMTIIDLKHKTGLNPGTIKRHITDLLEKKLVLISKEQISEFGVVMKFYRAVAKKYKFKLEWP
ncbi:MAG: helix-turn-helix domain-containing protein [Candidatus Heimdallarchaeaceae archaeon]